MCSIASTAATSTPAAAAADTAAMPAGPVPRTTTSASTLRTGSTTAPTLPLRAMRRQDPNDDAGLLRNCQYGQVDGAPVAVAVANSQFEADLIVGLLQRNGLDAAVSADDAGGQEPQLQLQGVRILVPPAEADAARKILADTEAEADADQPGD